VVLARWIPVYKQEKDHYWANAALIATACALMVHYAPSRDYLQKKLREPLSTVLLASPEWKRVYTDNISALFVRTALPHSPKAE
jgi:hypothetical protein